jgi:hypothetical protein
MLLWSGSLSLGTGLCGVAGLWNLLMLSLDLLKARKIKEVRLDGSIQDP